MLSFVYVYLVIELLVLACVWTENVKVVGK